MAETEKTTTLDVTTGIARCPYTYISEHCRSLGTRVFEGRLLVQRMIFMTGADAAALFYEPTRFTRIDAAPKAIQKTLFGVGGVQGLDGEEHLHRKQMFMSLMTPQRVDALAQMFREMWLAKLNEWPVRKQINLYEEIQQLITRSVCAWAGVPLPDDEVELRTKELTALFDAAGAKGLRHLWARVQRRRAEHWLIGFIEEIRAAAAKPSAESAAYVIAWHRGLDNSLLPPKIAAVELLNVLRPTVAVSVYISQVAHALYHWPELRARAEAGDDEYAEAFAQEVRRYYPFFPSLIARVREEFEWQGQHFPQGRRVVLDIYGTNHQPDIWGDFDTFRPERFLEPLPHPFAFIPQGGGDHHTHHRCPGEFITVALMKVALEILTRQMSYEVAEQDLSIAFDRMPAIPRSGFLLSNVVRR